MKVHSFWIKGELQKVNKLTIKSFQQQGHEFIIYSYVDLPDAGCEVRDANKILDKSNIYLYKNLPERFQLGGFAERLKAEMLFQLGGWHVDMDVTCLKSFSELDKREYVFRPHKLGAVGNIIKAPRSSDVSKMYLKWAKSINEHNTDFEKSIIGLYSAIVFLDLQIHIVSARTFGLDEDKYFVPFIQNAGAIPDKDIHAIHWCGALGHVANYDDGSFIHSLYKKYGIV